MSDTYHLVRRHPNGGFGVVEADLNSAYEPELMGGVHDRFILLRSAIEAAERESTEARSSGFRVHVECYSKEKK